jgi:hypothetical protein
MSADERPVIAGEIISLPVRIEDWPSWDQALAHERADEVTEESRRAEQSRRAQIARERAIARESMELARQRRNNQPIPAPRQPLV